MSHLNTCRTRVERFGLIDVVYYSEPDPACQDKSHHDAYTEETK
jgi:hypothetical protein